MKNLMDKFSKTLQRLIVRDNHTCWLCNERVRLDVDKNNFFAPSVDHVIEKRNDGWNSSDNYKLAHKFCNNVRSRYPEPKKHPKYNEIFNEWKKPSKKEKISLKEKKSKRNA